MVLTLLAAPAEETTVKLDLIPLVTSASWPIRITVFLLVVCSLFVWVIAVVKYLQLGRLRSTAANFERRAQKVSSAAELQQVATVGASSPGSRVVAEIFSRAQTTNIDRLRAIADRAIVSERQRARSLMASLASIASAAPFIGLFGTVYGIMDAFIRISASKSASLPVVAPAIGEALITTAIGLAAAIPAVVFYNSIDKRVGDVISELEASAAEWVALISEPVDATHLYRER